MGSPCVLDTTGLQRLASTLQASVACVRYVDVRLVGLSDRQVLLRCVARLCATGSLR